MAALKCMVNGKLMKGASRIKILIILAFSFAIIFWSIAIWMLTASEADMMAGSK